jgi:hypothetical protein
MSGVGLVLEVLCWSALGACLGHAMCWAVTRWPGGDS